MRAACWPSYQAAWLGIFMHGANPVECEHCGVTFKRKADNQKFCSIKCGRQSRNTGRTPIECDKCGQTFQPTGPRSLYCDACRPSWRFPVEERLPKLTRRQFDSKLDSQLQRYILSRDISKGHADNLRRALFMLQEFANRPLDEFSTTLVNEWLTAMLDSGRSRQTAKLYRRSILTIWNYLGDIEFQEYPIPRRIKQIKGSVPAPVAFRPEQVQELIKAASTLGGTYEVSGIPRGQWWPAMIASAYDTGLRRGDLWTLPHAISHGNPFAIVESKTGATEVRQLSRFTCDLIRQYDHRQAHPWGLANSSFAKGWKAIIKKVDFDGQFKMLRRSFVTLTEWRHADPTVSRRHYIDPTINSVIHRPPELG